MWVRRNGDIRLGRVVSLYDSLVVMKFLIPLLILFISTNCLVSAEDIGLVKAGEFTAPPNIRGKSAYIQLNHQGQETLLCVPTSASMVLNYYGKIASPREIKTLTRKHNYDPQEKFDDFTITFFGDLNSAVKKLGFRWETKGYPNDESGLRKGLRDITRSLDAEKPVLIDTSINGGHTFVVNGYDEDKEELIITDPAITSPGIRVISYGEIGRIWNSGGVGSPIRAAVYTDSNAKHRKLLREAAPKPKDKQPLIAMREWTNREGKTIKAAVLSADDKKAKLKRENGKIYNYEIEKLSEDDQEIIRKALDKSGVDL